MKDQSLLLTNLEGKDQLKDTIEKAKREFVSCQKCGGMRFNQIFILKKVTPLDDPQLEQNAVQPIPVFQCKKCGTLVNIA